MEEERDFYSILGVNKDVSKDDISKAYKKLALKYHPDRHVNDSPEEQKKCEEEFKKISEAYNTLSDDGKRKEYDMRGQNPFGEGGFNPFGEGGFNPFGGGFNPFAGFQGFNPFGFGNAGNDNIDGDDISVNCDISLKDAYNGTETTITYQKSKKCHHCNGTGSSDGKEHKCPHCNGTGKTMHTMQRGNTLIQQMTECPYCHGTGKDISNVAKCSHCNGTGLESSNETIKIKVPRGAYDGLGIEIQGAGGEARGNGGKPGNLIVTFHIIDYNGFEPVPGTINLRKTVEISLKEALLGFSKKIECIDGNSVTIESNSPTNNGTEFVFEKKGMQHPERNYIIGNLTVEVKVKLPHVLSQEDKDIIGKLSC